MCSRDFIVQGGQLLAAAPDIRLLRSGARLTEHLYYYTPSTTSHNTNNYTTDAHPLRRPYTVH